MAIVTEGSPKQLQRWYEAMGINHRRVVPYWCKGRNVPITDRRVQDHLIGRMKQRNSLYLTLDNFGGQKHQCYPDVTANDERPADGIFAALHRVIAETEAWGGLVVVHTGHNEQHRPRGASRFLDIVEDRYAFMAPSSGTDRRLKTEEGKDTADIDWRLGWNKSTRLYHHKGDWHQDAERPREGQHDEAAAKDAERLRVKAAFLLVVQDHPGLFMGEVAAKAKEYDNSLKWAATERRGIFDELKREGKIRLEEVTKTKFRCFPLESDAENERESIDPDAI
jgi:hypothetical protein